MSVESPWNLEDGQVITIQDRKYDVLAAIFLSKDLPLQEVKIKLLNRSLSSLCEDNFMDFISHMKAVNDSDLSYPIILNEFGAIIDGRHRLAKAILKGGTTINAVQFDKDPRGIYTDVE